MSIENSENIVKSIGSKEEVYNGQANKTSGGLKKDDLILNAHGKVVSKKRSEHGKKMASNLKRKQNIEEEHLIPEASNESLPIKAEQKLLPEECFLEQKQPPKLENIPSDKEMKDEETLQSFLGEKIKKPRKKKN